MIGELNFLFFIILLVLNYFGSTIVGKLATSLGKYVDDLARLGVIVKVKNIVFHNTTITSGGKITTELKKLNFKSQLEMVSNERLIIKEVFKGDLEGIAMSDIIIEQLKFAGKDSNKLIKIGLDDVVNIEILDALKNNSQKYVIDNWGNIGGLEGMTVKLLERIGKKISEVKIYKYRDEYYRNVFKYDIELILN